MVIDHLLSGMILQAWRNGNPHSYERVRISEKNTG